MQEFGRTALLLAAGLGFGLAPALAAPAPKHPAPKQRHHGLKRVTVGELTAQGLEVKAVIGQDGLVLQKGEQVYWCTMRVANTSPLSYQSDCYAVH